MDREASSTPLIPSAAAASPSSPSTEESRNIKEEDDKLEVEGRLEQEEVKQSQGDDSAAVAADDDGYQTPTSPRHRIPEPLTCPSAPKKPSSVLYLKWRKRNSQARGEEDAERESAFDESRAELDEFAPMAKKPRGEAAAAK